MVLEKDRKWIGALGLSRSRFVDQFDTVMHLTSVKHDGDFCRGRFFPSLIESGGGEVDVVSLPDHGRQAHVHVGATLFVQGTTFVDQPLEAKRVQNLHFVPTLDIDSAVAPALPTLLWFKRCSKFKMQIEIFNRFFSEETDVKCSIIFTFCLKQATNRFSIEKNIGTLRRLCTQSRTLSSHVDQAGSEPF